MKRGNDPSVLQQACPCWPTYLQQSTVYNVTDYTDPAFYDVFSFTAEGGRREGSHASLQLCTGGL